MGLTESHAKLSPKDEPIQSKVQSRRRLNLAIAPHLCVGRQLDGRITRNCTPAVDSTLTIQFVVNVIETQK
jgi:hypothetical protein